MESTTCPACACVVEAVDVAEDVIVACPKCGRFLRVLTPWTVRSPSGIAPPPDIAVRPSPAAIGRTRPAEVNRVLAGGLVVLWSLGVVASVAIPASHIGPYERAAMVIGSAGMLLLAVAGVVHGRRRGPLRPLLVRLPRAFPEGLERLGTPVSVHDDPAGERAALVAFGLVAIVVGGLAALAVIEAGRPMHKLLELAALGLVGGPLLIAGALRRGPSRVVVFAEGLAWAQRGRFEAWRWDEIEGAEYLEKPRGDGLGPAGVPARSYTLRHRSGRALRLRDCRLRRFDELARAIAGGTAGRLGARQRAAIEAGGWVAFGPIVIDREGLDEAGHRLAWTDVAAVEVDATHVQLFGKGRRHAWLKRPLDEVPNASMFADLARALADRR